jgi:NADH dehydrogenase FAD-containing subunit
MSCQAAGPLGAQAADTVLSRLAGEEPATITVGFTGQCLSLGRKAGIFQFAHKDDTPKGFYLDGWTGARLKEFVCKVTVKQMVEEARKPGSHTWAKNEKRRQLATAGSERTA